jgi:sulfonate transport system substrate-binding protein
MSSRNTPTVLTRRTLIATSAATFALAACHGRRGQVLKVGSQRGSTKSVMLASGALDGAGYTVEWSEFPAAQNLLEALGSGAVDLGLVGDAPFQFAFQSGSPIRAVGAMAATAKRPGALGILVAAGSHARGIDDLVGRKLATTHGSIGHYVILRALQLAGHPANAVKLVFLSPSDSQAALQTGAVDAWSTWAPYTIAATAAGARTLIDGRTVTRSLGYDVASDAAIKDKRTTLTDFLTRETRALAWAADHTAAYAQVLSHETGLPLPIAQATAACSTRVRTPIDPHLIADQQVILDTFRTAGDLTTPRPLAQAFDALV